MEDSQRHLPGLQLQESQPRPPLPLRTSPKETGMEKLSLGMEKLPLRRKLGFRVVRILAYSVLFWLTYSLAAIMKGAP